MGGYGSFNYQQQKSQQQSDSMSGLRGTKYEGRAAGETFNQGKLMSGVTNLGMGNIAQDPQQWFRFGQQLMPGGQYGMGSNVDNAVAMLGRNMFSQTSGDMARRGFSSPESQNAVVGSALQNSATQLIPQMMQFQQQQFLAPQTLLNAANTSADFWNRALGSRATSSGTGSGFGFGVAGGGGMYGSGGK